ncbi:hypothetical protein KS35_001112 [Salmonella enterica subsp. enterica]|nr:hypothetical protein [Salmonella enterica subsp. enterica]
MDVLSGLTAAKQAYDLLKTIKETRDDAVIATAVGDLHQRITELQMLNAELSGLYQAEKDVAMKLRDENRKIEMFIVQAENYELHTTEGGSVVYRSKLPSDSVVQSHYLCTHCFGEHKISILQPSVETIKSMGFFVHHCPRCKNQYRMNKVPPLPDIHVPPLSRW